MTIQMDSTHGIQQQLENFQQNEDSDSVAIMFIVGVEVRLIHLVSGVSILCEILLRSVKKFMYI